MKINAILIPDNGKTLTEAFEPLVDSLGTRSFGKGLLALGALKLAGAMNDRTFSALLDRLKPKMTAFVNDLLVKKAIFADAAVDEVAREGDTLRVSVTLTDVDYPALADKYLPALIESERRRVPDGLPAAVSDGMGDEQSAAVGAFLDALSETAKERIAARVLSGRKTRVCERLSGSLKKRGLDLSVTDVGIV